MPLGQISLGTMSGVIVNLTSFDHFGLETIVIWEACFFGRVKYFKYFDPVTQCW